MRFSWQNIANSEHCYKVESFRLPVDSWLLNRRECFLHCSVLCAGCCRKRNSSQKWHKTGSLLFERNKLPVHRGHHHHLMCVEHNSHAPYETFTTKKPGSFDPNKKEASPELARGSLPGKYLGSLDRSFLSVGPATWREAVTESCHSNSRVGCFIQ
jgi:hypothetical protein